MVIILNQAYSIEADGKEDSSGKLLVDMDCLMQEEFLA
jgi:hypothetical protein